MKQSILCFLVVFLCMYNSCTSFRGLNSASCTIKEYYSESPENYNLIFRSIRKYYPEFNIDQCLMKITRDEYSRINVETNTILLSKKHEIHSVKTIAHEISHLALADLTDRVNLYEKHRFFDEGFANIVCNTATGELDSYKMQSIQTATEQFFTGNLSWDRIQDWNTYFDRYGKRNWNAYLIGSSFVFFVIDTYGIETLYKLFADLVKTKDIEISIWNILNKGTDQIESQWIEYLLSHDFSKLPQPKITTLYPDFGETNVTSNIKEIFIEFDQPMSTSKICISSNCKNGICFKNAFWETEKRLVIKIKPRLISNYEYNIYIGNDKGCNLISKAGAKFPRTLWNFSTAE